jgi:hypothetical protein
MIVRMGWQGILRRAGVILRDSADIGSRSPRGPATCTDGVYLRILRILRRGVVCGRWFRGFLNDLYIRPIHHDQYIYITMH